MIEKLSTTVRNFTHIIHVADIHIRLTKRHDEYREVFQKFYDAVAASPETSVVCVLGDVCHSKSDLSPECVQMISEFLWNLAERRETILVPGNHDATLSNKTRLDSLSPVVDALNHSSLHYLKETKLYGIGNILFNNMSIFDEPEKYVLGKDIPEIYRSEYKHIIALFHGPVDRCMTDTGFSISNPAIMPALFDWHDIALLGDIHRRQNMQESKPEEHKPCIHYPGSLIQQTHGEPLHPHGYTIWNLSAHSYKYIEVPNDYGYFTIELHKGKLLTDLDELPPKTHLRVKCFESIATEVKAAIAEVKNKTLIVETAYVRVESEADKLAKEKRVCKDVKLMELADVDYQGKLITEYLTQKLNITDQATIDKILLINRDTNTEIKKDEFSRNLHWKPIRFEWDNMFSYGEGNFIDFAQMSGTYGLFGPNQSGKSSVFSALCFCLFDKWERGFKAIVVRNSSKQTFRCKFEFEISGVHYFIEKNGDTTKSGNVKVDVAFWKEVNGARIDLTDEMRRKTNDVIRDYVGTFDDFILTSLSIQNATKNNVNFIDMGNTDRKDLLVQFIGLNVFDRLYDAAYLKGKELASRLKPHKEKNYISDLNTAESNLALAESTLRDCQDGIDDYIRQIRGINDQIVKETAKLIALDKDVPTAIESIEDKKQKSTKDKEDAEAVIIKCRTERDELKTKVDELDRQVKEVAVDDLVKVHKLYDQLKDESATLSKSFELKKVGIDHKMQMLANYRKQYKYDPECKFCVDNLADKDSNAQKTEQELEKDHAEAEEIKTILRDVMDRLEEHKWVVPAYDNYTKLLNTFSDIKTQYEKRRMDVKFCETTITILNQHLEELNKRIQLYYQNQVAAENNLKINTDILAYKFSHNRLEFELNKKNKQSMELSGKIALFKNEIKTTTETIQTLIALEEERALFDLYTKTIGRNGIPFQVICSTVPELEREVNSILTQITNFIVVFEIDEKNVSPYIKTEDRGQWPIEMASGFERFVVSIAIRVALTNITNLPRTTFLAIDEGFSSLDASNLPSLQIVFTLLKNNYDFVIVISHLDALRDMVDKQIEITREGGFGKLVFER